MRTPTVEAELREQLHRLPLEQQYQVLEFVRSLQVKGVPGKVLVRFAGTFSAADLAVIKRAAEEDCNHIDHGEW